MESPGIASAWGQAELYDNDFIVNPHGPGWHVDRRRFDAMLARAAEESGVEVLRGASGIIIGQVPRTGRVAHLPTSVPRALGAGLHDPAVCRTEGLTPAIASETFGQLGGKVRRPCHSTFTWPGALQRR